MWQIHCAKNTLKSALPFQRQLRALKRRIDGNPSQINEQSVFSGGFDQIFLLREAGLDIRGRDVLEVGSGWYPVIPLMLRLAGARHVTMTDAHALMDLDTLATATEFLRRRKETLAERLEIDPEEIESYLELAGAESFAVALDQLGLSYAVPFDYTQSDVKVDAIISHTVFEHIPPDVISALLTDAHHVLRPGGFISHGVDHSDHRANVDRRLSRIDFLRYTDRMWRLLCLDPQDFTNRLRHADYLELVKRAGFQVAFERTFVDEKCMEDLKTLPLARRFQDSEAKNLATLWSNIIARRAEAIA